MHRQLGQCTRQSIFVLIILVIVCVGCGGEQVYTPKPRMYPRVHYPERGYVDFDMAACAFSFKSPAYATVEEDITFFDEEPAHECWFDLELKELNASIHFTYSPIDAENPLDKLIIDAFNIADQHNIKADYRDDKMIENPNGVNGLLFNIEGPVASPVNFLLTDTTDHFVRASLYFNDKVNPDSIAPILAFVKSDIDTIIHTFDWKD